MAKPTLVKPLRVKVTPPPTPTNSPDQRAHLPPLPSPLREAITLDEYEHMTRLELQHLRDSEVMALARQASGIDAHEPRCMDNWMQRMWLALCRKLGLDRGTR